MSKKVVKLAVIRTNDGQRCPFGLKIPFACRNAGELVTRMAPLEILGEDADPSDKKALTRANRMLFMSESEGCRCVYAGKVFKEKGAVECNQASNAPGISPEQGMTPSPFYSKVYDNIAYDGLYSYPMGWYGDSNISRNLYYGVYSLQGSEDKKEMEKVGQVEEPDED